MKLKNKNRKRGHHYICNNADGIVVISILKYAYEGL